MKMKALLICLMLSSFVCGMFLMSSEEYSAEEALGHHHLMHVTWTNGIVQYGSYYGMLFNYGDEELYVTPWYCAEKEGRRVAMYEGTLYVDSSKDSIIIHIEPHQGAFFEVVTSDSILVKYHDLIETYMIFEVEK